MITASLQPLCNGLLHLKSTPPRRFWKIVPQKGCELGLSKRDQIFHLEEPNELIYLEFTLPLYEMFFKCSTGGVWNSNGVAQYTLTSDVA